MDERAIILNELAQGLRPIAQGVGCFESLGAEEQLAALQDLAGYSIQARATSDDGAESVVIAGIRPTHTPAVLIVRGRPIEQLPRIVNLPRDERVKSFRLLVALLGVADKRRREQRCAMGCSHAWHQLAADREKGTATS